jgi:hypothetical protein
MDVRAYLLTFFSCVGFSFLTDAVGGFSLQHQPRAQSAPMRRVLVQVLEPISSEP